jgi:PBP1b-binding outer membrane lipoprotein LpoB
MKIRIILLISLLSILLSGCSSTQENNLVEDGETALEKHDYEKAKEILSEALEVDNADEHARAMYMQAIRMENLVEYEKQKNYKKAIKEIEFIENIKNGSVTIKSEASKKKKEIVKLDEEYEKEQAQRKEKARVESSKDRYRIEQQALRAHEEYLSKKEEQKKKEEIKQPEEINPPEDNNQNTEVPSAKPLLPQAPQEPAN